MVTAVTSFGRSGLYDWLIQRCTAVVLAAYTIFLLGYLFCSGDISYAQWSGLFENTAMRIFSFIALVSLGAHAWIGMWAVVTDYLTERTMGAKGPVLRIITQIGGGIILFAYMIWGVEILWGI